MKIRFLIVVVWLLSGWLTGNCHSIYPVQRVADIPLDGNRWDLSRCELIDNEIDFKVDYSSEKHRVWSPVKRFDFVKTMGDTVFQTCAETRRYRVIFSPGILRGVPDGTDGLLNFNLKGRISQSHWVIGTGTSQVQPLVTGDVITATGDSIHDARLHRHVASMRWIVTPDSLLDFSTLPDSAIYTSIVETSFLLAPGEEFPCGLKRIDTTIFSGKTVSRDSISWVANYTPSVEANRAKNRLANRLTKQPDSNNPTKGKLIDDSEISVVTSPTELNISSQTDQPAIIVITDAIGRLYHQSRATLTPMPHHIDTEALPRGEYLLQIIPDSGNTIATKFLRN